jgi:hypothetical protein
MGLRTLGMVNLGKFWMPENQQIKGFFKTVEKVTTFRVLKSTPEK